MRKIICGDFEPKDTTAKTGISELCYHVKAHVHQTGQYFTDDFLDGGWFQALNHLTLASGIIENNLQGFI